MDRRLAPCRTPPWAAVRIGIFVLEVGSLALPGAVAGQDAIAVRPGFDAERWLAPTAGLELELSRPLTAADGRLAVLVGTLDLSALVTVRGNRARYRPRGVHLPPGESDLVAYLVDGTGGWQEIGRFGIRVLTRGGFERARVTPSVTLHSKGQLLEGHAPTGNVPPRAEFQDFGLNLGLQSDHARDGWTIRSQANLLGVTNRQESLRFGQRGDQAPRFDLSDYLIEIQRGRAGLTVGHLTYGSHRHLIRGFEGRGLGLSLPLGRVASLTLAGLSGSKLVGWSNPLGVRDGAHRLLGGTFGLELVPRRPGAFQVEVSYLTGSVQPQAGFSQGAVIEPEESRGGGIRLAASDASQRLRLEAGFARTRFTNPHDPALAQGAALVPVRPVTRSARYLEAGYQVLRDVTITPAMPLTLALAARHERVEPLYRSVAAPESRADLHQNAVQADLGLGPLSAQVVHTRGHDNLDHIPTILTTLTRSTTVSLALPLPALAGAPPSWLPMLTYGLTRLHQRGDSVPTLGGFTPTFVPDQVSVSHTLGATWQGAGWRAGYQLNRATQDNRQAGRDAADFVSQVHLVSLGITLASDLDLGLDGGFERSDNRELAQQSTTHRLAGLVIWRFTATSALVGSVARTRMADSPRTLEQTVTDLRLELSQRMRLPGARPERPPAQLFVRYTHQLGDRRAVAGAPDRRRSWSVNSGLTLSLF